MAQKMNAKNDQKNYNFMIFSSGGPESHADLIKKLQTTNRNGQKTIQKLSKELATHLARMLNDDPNPPPFFFLHRSDGVEMDFATTFLKNAKPKIFYFVTIADGIDSKSGSLVLQGDAVDVDAISGEAAKILDGKGNGKNGRFQAKVTKLNKLKDCEVFVKKYFENK
jgi:misacylated tRNA(Ala) deacylase